MNITDDPNNHDDQINQAVDDDTKHQQAKPPSVTGEEDVFSGDATSSESPDIDEELKKVGLQGDQEGIKPLGLDSELDEEEE